MALTRGFTLVTGKGVGRSPFAWFAVASVFGLASYFLVRRLLLDLPHDFLSSRAPAKRPHARALRNAVGFLLILVGILLLFLPGPGLALVVLGLGLTDFAGRTRVIRGLLARKGILHFVNTFRVRHGRAAIHSGLHDPP